MKASRLLFACILAQPLLAQSVDYGTRSAALAGHQSVLQAASATLYANPAMLPALTAPAVQLGYFQPYQLTGVAGKSLSVAQRSGQLAFAAGVAEFGNRLYREQFFSAAAAGTLTSAFSAGLRLNWLRTSIVNYGNWNRFTFDLGAAFMPGGPLQYGVLLKNLASGSGTAAREIRTGIAWTLQQNNTLYFEVIRPRNQTTALTFAAKFSIHPRFAVLAGTGYNTPVSLSAGFLLAFPRLRFTYAVQLHNTLAATHRFAFTFQGEQ